MVLCILSWSMSACIQVDVAVKQRQWAEADCEKLKRRIQMIREMLMYDTGSIQLSEEKKSTLAFLNRGQPSIGYAEHKKTVNHWWIQFYFIRYQLWQDGWIAGLGFFGKDFQTKEERKEALHNQQVIDSLSEPIKKAHSIGSTVDQDSLYESILAKTIVTLPNDGRPFEIASTIETVP